ncbi:hypothetical protein Ahy_A07g032822 [Arachis hypogaea]|uniref:Cytochrome P450 n=1 Tax=Arachis hypogaea TaxID=3818 RepID=A0A445C7S4_ARAHY|nr:hypothetical protein Ahy_A07g032822 [Arachis hypogaea]
MSSLAMVLQFDPKFLTSIALVVVSVVLFMLYNDLVVKPKRLRSKLSNQGINGPTPSFMIGNIWEIKKAKELITTTPKSPNLEPVDVHDCASLTFPFIETWKQKYGKVFTFSIGNTQILVVNKPEIVRDIITCKSLDLGRPSYEKRTLGPLLGQGIATSNGTKWAQPKKDPSSRTIHGKGSSVISIPHETNVDKLPQEMVEYRSLPSDIIGMMTMIGECATSLVNSWDDIIKENGGSATIKVDEYFREFSGDVISRACFGSNYSKGKQIFSKLEALQEILSKNSLVIWIPGIIKYLPTRNNREAWKLEKDVKNCILEVVRDRKEYANDDNNKFKDLLQMVLEAAKNSNLSEGVIEHFIVDNCKTIYVAGYETTAITAAWCLMLLASNQEWQDLVRAEALQICNGQIPDSTMLSKMKQLTMVIHETLRLYSPIPVISREALR